MAVKTLTKKFTFTLDGPPSAEFPNLADTHIHAFIDLVCGFRQVSGLLNFTIYILSPANYRYKFTLPGGRIWEQTADVSLVSDIGVSTDTLSGLWKLSEIDTIRSIRNEALSIMTSNPYLSEVSVDYVTVP